MTGNNRKISAVNELMNDYAKNGYCIISYNTDNCIALEKYIASLDYTGAGKNFVYSLLTFNTETNIEISKRVTDFFKTALQNPVASQFLTGSFLIKPGNISTELLLHQDWTYTDFTQQAPVTCWAPLIDTGPQSGGIFLIKGSHTFFKNYRSNSYPTQRFGIAEIESGAVTFLKVNRGEVLLFDPSIWHGSAVNTGAMPRIAVTCLMLAIDTNLLYFHKRDEHTCEVYELPEYGLETHLRSLVKNEIPGALKLVKTVPYNHNMPTQLDLAKAFIIA